MSWQSVIGQSRAKELLRRSLRSQQVAHAYLFSGPDGVGKYALAIEFARALNCSRQSDEACDVCESCLKVNSLQHPNIHLIVALPLGKNEEKGDGPLDRLSQEQIESLRDQFARKAQNPYHRISVPNANFIKINSIREIRRESAMSMFELGRKVYILSNADEMNVDASNALLKTLEEPSPHTVLILTTSRRDRLLSTIVSRCQLVHCDTLDEGEIADQLLQREQTDQETARLVAQLAEGSYTRALELLAADVSEYRRDIVAFMRAALSSKPSTLLPQIEKLTLGSDRDSVERSLRLLHVWLREALVVRERGGASHEFVDDDVRRFVEKFPHANLVAALECVESSIALVGKNVYLPLILVNLSFDLRRHSSSPAPF